MNVLSPAPASSTVPTLATSPQAVAESTSPAAVQPMGQLFTQVWGQQVAQAWAATSAQATSVSTDAVEGAEVQTAPVVLGEVLPVLHLPAQQPRTIDHPQPAASVALGLDAGETLEMDAVPEDVLPAMQMLSALPVVHPQLRREAVAAVEAAAPSAPAVLLGHVTDAVVRSNVTSGAGVETVVSTPALNAPVAAPASGVSKEASALVQALGQRIQLQQAQGQDVVMVRLDPPQWGRVEIRIQQDASGVQVLLQASHAEVGRQLTTVVDSLRQELQARTGGEASVVVHSQRSMAGQGQGERQAHQGEQDSRSDDPVGQALQFELGDSAV